MTHPQKTEFKALIQGQAPGSNRWSTIQVVHADNPEQLRGEATRKVSGWRFHARDHNGSFSNWRFRSVVV